MAAASALSSSSSVEDAAAREELARLLSNYTELQQHQQTLRWQLQARSAQAKQLQGAVAECRALLRAAAASSSADASTAAAAATKLVMVQDAASRGEEDPSEESMAQD